MTPKLEKSSFIFRKLYVALALTFLTEQFLSDVEAGVCRVHGDGFAGTIQVFLPNENVSDYTRIMGF